MSKSWSKTTRYFVLVLVLGALIWLLVAANELIAPLAVSALLAYVMNPAVVYVNKRTKVSREWVVLSVYVLLLAALVITAVLLIPFIPAQASSLAIELRQIGEQIRQNLAQPIYFLGFRVPLDEIIAGWPAFSDDYTRPDLIVDILRATTTNLVWVLVVLVTTFYLIRDWPRLREWFLNIVPDAYGNDARRLYNEIREVWQRYLQGQLRLMFIIGVLTGLASAIIGLPGAFAFGIFAGLFDAVLSLGPAIVMAVAAIVAFVLGSTHLPVSNFWFAIIVLIVYGAIQAIENVWLRPRIMGNTLRLHPAIVFVAIVGSLALAGVLTALIIVPLIGSVMVMGRYVYCKLLDIEPWDGQQPTVNSQQSTANNQQSMVDE